MEQTYISILEGLEHLSHTQGCEYCGILSKFSITQSEIQETVVLLQELSGTLGRSMALVNFTFTYKVSVWGVEWLGESDSLILFILMLRCRVNWIVWLVIE